MGWVGGKEGDTLHRGAAELTEQQRICICAGPGIEGVGRCVEGGLHLGGAVQGMIRHGMRKRKTWHG